MMYISAVIECVCACVTVRVRALKASELMCGVTEPAAGIGEWGTWE